MNVKMGISPPAATGTSDPVKSPSERSEPRVTPCLSCQRKSRPRDSDRAESGDPNLEHVDSDQFDFTGICRLGGAYQRRRRS